MVIISVLVFADIIGFLCRLYLNLHYLNGFFRLFDLDQETNIPSFYSALSLLSSALLLFYISYSKRGTKDFLSWFSLGLVFTYLSLDEACVIHEMLINLFRNTFHTSGLLYDAWVIPYGIAMVIAGIIFIPFLIRLPRKTMILLVIAGAIYVSGAVGVEMIQGDYEEIHGTQNIIYSVSVVIEESMEMFGIALFIFALLKYISLTPNHLTLTFTDKKIRE
jgi:hypothetical protein